MGLDMYLMAKKHISNYDFRPDQRKMNAVIKEAIGLTGFDDDDAYVEVSVNVGYWRKANQIHAWFVDNCQGGEDDCETYRVEREQLVDLWETCCTAYDEKDPEILKPREGFFFGSTDIDDYYWEDLENTVKLLEKVLASKELEGCTFYYQASW